MLEEVFYLTPEPMPEVITDRKILETLTTQQLKGMAKKRDVKGLSKLKKADLVELLVAA
ncbi:MAG: Rho termination factor N-terminal domain-containing protein [Nodosilinea sp.]